MKENKKKYIFYFFVTLTIAVVFKYFQNSSQHSLVNKSIKVTENNNEIVPLQNKEVQRSPASVKIKKPNKPHLLTNIKDLDSHQAIIDKTSKMYFSKLPKNIEWDLTHIADLSQGNQLKVSLHNIQTGEKTSYHALVDKDSGRILTTWHREIRH